MQSALSNNHDIAESQNCVTITKVPRRKRYEKWNCLQNYVSALQSVLCRQSSRHLQSRFKEHINNEGPMKKHLRQCHATTTIEEVEILGSTQRGEIILLTLEALWINVLQPTINSKDEYRRRSLAIKL